MRPPTLSLLSALAAICLLLSAACRADAAEVRRDLVYVTDCPDGLGTLARAFGDAGYATAVVGWLRPASLAAEFDAHCLWDPAKEPRRWGPTLRDNGQVVTYPDDVSATSLFLDFVTGFCSPSGSAPAFVAFLTEPGGDLPSVADLAAATAETLRGTATPASPPRQRTIVLGSTDGGGAEGTVTFTWVGARKGVPTSRRLRSADVVPTLLELASLSREGVEGTSFAGELDPPAMRRTDH